MIHFQNNLKLSDAQRKMIIIALLGLVVATTIAQVTPIPRSAGYTYMEESLDPNRITIV